MTSEQDKAGEDVLGDEYDRIFQNELIYFEEVSLWEKLKKLTIGLTIASFLLLISPYFSMPLDVLQNPLNYVDLFVGYPTQMSLNVGGAVLAFISVACFEVVTNKISKIKREIGLHREEELFLHAYESHKSINSFLQESNAKRKIYFKKLAIESTQRMSEISQELTHGNVRLVRKIMGNQINLLKDNINRLILPNVAKGDEEVLEKVSGLLVSFCEFIHIPTLEGLTDLNNQIAKLPFEEYQYFNTRERMGKYFANKPRMSRLIFAFVITTFIVVISYCLEQPVAVISALAVASFWGAFSGFDKIFPPQPN